MAKRKAGVNERAADILDREAGPISARWALRIASEIYSDRPDLTPRKLEDGAVSLVRGVAEALRRGQPTNLKAPWTGAAREHAAERRDQNVAIGDLVREYEVMREEFWKDLERELTGISGEEAIKVARGLDIAINTMVAIATSTYAEQLRRALEDASRLPSVVEASVDAILYVSPEGIIMNWNRGAEEIYGYPAGQVVGKPLAVLIPPERSGEFDKTFARLRRGETIRRFDTERVREDGSRVAIALTAAPIRDAEGQMTGFSWVARDITERKRAEAERERLLDQVERRAAEVDATISAISDGLIIYGPRADCDDLDQSNEQVILSAPGFHRHSRESGNPPRCRALDSRFRGNDSRGYGDDGERCARGRNTKFLNSGVKRSEESAPPKRLSQMALNMLLGVQKVCNAEKEMRS